MRRLGVTHHVLGEDPGRGVPSRYRDSGMAGTPTAADPRAFVNADLAEAAGLVAQHLRVVRPDVVVTYDEHGGYAHPDHIRTHEVTMAALRQLDHDAAACGVRRADPAAVGRARTGSGWRSTSTGEPRPGSPCPARTTRSRPRSCRTRW